MKNLKPYLFLSVLLVGFNGAADGHGTAMARELPTLDGKPPIVIGHRGLPGLYPEETRPSYEKAADAGADSLELDLHMTKDCMLVARHNPWLSDNTNIVDVAKKNPSVAARKRTTPGRWQHATWSTADAGPTRYLVDRLDPKDPRSVLKPLVVDGQAQDGGDFTNHAGDWSISDFTFAELRQWVGGTTYDARDQRPSKLNGKYPVLSLQEVIDIAKQKSKKTKRVITIYPEIKNPVWNNGQAIANGCGAVGSHPFEDALIKTLDANGLNGKNAPIFIQGFDPASLKYLRAKGVKSKMVQLIDAVDVDYKTGAVIFKGKDFWTIVSGRPYSWTIAGKPELFNTMLTPAGLATIKKYADGIGAWKPMVVALSVAPWKEGAGLTNANRAVPTKLVADAHKAGLFVHVYTFRNEKKYLAELYNGEATAEYLNFFEAGVDGVFTDFTPTAVAARQLYLKSVDYKQPQ